MRLHSSFVTLIFALSAFGTAVKRDAAKVEADIGGLQTQTRSLGASIEAFNDTLEQAMAVHQNAVTLRDMVQSATSDINDSAAFSEAESSSMVEPMQTLVDLVRQALADLVNKKAAFTSVGVVPVVGEDLMALSNDANSFGKAMMPKVSAAQKSTAQNDLNAIDNAFGSAKQAYGDS